MTDFIIRPVKITDAEDIAKIYEPYVSNTCVSFEYIPPSKEEFEKRIADTVKNYPYLVCEVQGRIAGYAYASAHGSREGYKYTANSSIYLSESYQNMGIGRALYEELFKLLFKQGIYTVFASVSSDNPDSLAFHHAMGFITSGVFNNVAFKAGKWLSLTWLQLALRSYSCPDAEQ